MTLTLQIVYLAAIAIALTLSLAIIYLCDKQSNQVTARYLAYIVLISTGISLCWLGTSLAPVPEIAYFWTRLRLAVVPLTGMVSLALVLHYLDWRIWLRFPYNLLLWFIPLVNLCFSLFLPEHPWFISQWSWMRYEILGLETIEFGGLQSLNNIYYLAIVLLSLWMLRYRYQLVSQLINLQTAWILGGILMVWFLTSLRAWNLLPPGFPAPYPVGAAIGSLMVIRGLHLSPLTDVVPIGHELIFRDMPQGVIVLNQERFIADFNRLAELFFPPHDNPRGQPITHYPTLATAYDNYKTQPEIAIADRHYTVGVSSIQRRNGAMLGQALILTDITERKQSDLERERLLTTLDAYARTVAHDLKNPVGVISGYVELAQMKLGSATSEDHARAQEYMEKAQQSTKTMLNIINSMLLLATLRDNETLSLELIDMENSLKSVLERLAFEIQRTGAEVHISGPLLPAMGYRSWVEETWLNYLSNALKYGGTPPNIHISSNPDPYHPDRVQYSVRDNGFGLTSLEQANLFREGRRLERHSEIEGHGLGLTIVRQMVERMQGRVMVESAPGAGSTFSFALLARSTS